MDLGDRVVVPGKRVGSLELGMCYARVSELLGFGEPVACQALGFVRYPDLGLELIFATLDPGEIASNSRMIAIGLRGEIDWAGMPRLKDRREDIEGSLGEGAIVGQRSLYSEGASIQYDEAGRVSALAVIAPFVTELFPRSHAALERW